MFDVKDQEANAPVFSLVSKGRIGSMGGALLHLLDIHTLYQQEGVEMFVP